MNWLRFLRLEDLGFGLAAVFEVTYEAFRPEDKIFALCEEPLRRRIANLRAADPEADVSVEESALSMLVWQKAHPEDSDA